MSSELSPTIAPETAARYGRERTAHNKIFSEHTRAKAEKFYSIVRGSRACYEQVLRTRCGGKAVLEYGCGAGSHSHFLARHGAAHVVGIDISDVAIEQARALAAERGLAQVEHVLMNAEALTFEPDSFDLICGTAILHHLDLNRACAELSRTLRPGGTAVFLEPLGHNPFINLYRRLTPRLRTIDEHPLLIEDLRTAAAYFERVDTQFFNLHTLAAVPFRQLPLFESLVKGLDALDRTLFRLWPGSRKYAWQVVITLTGPRTRPLETV